MSQKNTSNDHKIPEHIAIIMDGNGRWAKKRGLPRAVGHKRGAETTHRVVEYAANAGVKHLTLFGFSSENWNRPKDEIKDLMNLLRHYLRSKTAELHKNNVKLTVIGNRTPFSNDIIELIHNAEKLTHHNTAIHVVIALNYGGQQDIIQATHRMIADAVNKKSCPDLDDVQALLPEYLMTKNIPDPDLLIRTSGEQRISNFLLWQCAYTEIVFTQTLWPDFMKNDFDDALQEYAKRDRRFGALKQSEA